MGTYFPFIILLSILGINSRICLILSMCKLNILKINIIVYFISI